MLCGWESLLFGVRVHVYGITDSKVLTTGSVVFVLPYLYSLMAFDGQISFPTCALDVGVDSYSVLSLN